VKISERGQEENLMSEFDESDIIDGGYQENKGVHWSQVYKKSMESDLEEAKDVQV